MNKYTFSIQEPLLFFLSFCLLAFIILILYRYGFKSNSRRIKLFLITIRLSATAILLLLFFNTSIEHFFESSDERPSLILIDKSQSLDSHADQLNKTVENIVLKRPNSELVYFNDKPHNKTTNFIDSVNKLNPEKYREVYLISDGNQTEYSKTKAQYPFPIYSIPIGIMPDTENYDINVKSFPNILDLNESAELVLRFSNQFNVNGRLNIKVNDSTIVDKQTIIRKNAIFKERIYAGRKGNNKIDISFFSEEKQLRKSLDFFVKDEKKVFLHIFKKPNLEAKFIKTILSENPKYHIRSKDIRDLNAEIDPDFLILSDLNSEDFIKLKSLINRFELKPGIIINSKNFNYLNYFQVKTDEKLLSSLPEISPEMNELFLGVNKENLPKVRFKKIDIKKLQKDITSQAVFSDFMSLVSVSGKEQFLILSSLNFWKLKLQGQIYLSYSQLYTNIVNRITTKILSANESIIEIQSGSKIYPSSNNTITVKIKNSYKKSLIYDELELKLYHNKKVIEEKEFSPNEEFTINYVSPDSGYIRIAASIKSRDKLILRENKYISVKRINRELKNKLVNSYILQELSRNSHGGKFLLDFEDIEDQNKEKNKVINSERENLIRYEYLLIAVILLMSVDWYFRKKLQLP